MSNQNFSFNPAAQAQAGGEANAQPQQQAQQPQYQQPDFGQQQQQQQFQQPQPWQASNPFADLGGVFDLQISRNSSNQVLSKLHSQLKEAAESFTSQYSTVELELLTLNREDVPSVSMSGIILVMRQKDLNGRISPAVFHTYLVEATGDDMSNTNVTNVGGMAIEDRHYASNAYDKDFAVAARQLVMDRSAFARTGMEPVFAEAALVPAIADLENKDEINRMLISGLLACRTILNQTREDWKDFVLPLETNQQFNLRSKVKIDRRQQHRRDYMGMPVRNDISITLETNIPQPNQNYYNQQQQYQKKIPNVVIGHATAYMDMAYMGRNPSGMMNFGAQYQAPYALTCVLTSLESASLTSINGQGLVLASVFSLYENHVALQALDPIPGKKDDMHNIGTLNIEANVVGSDANSMQNPMLGLAQQRGAEVDVHSANFNEVAQYKALLFNPRFELALDVSECGADTWLNSVFIAAAMGNPDANQAIFDSWNALTNGKFAANLQAMNLMGAPFFVFAGRVLMGHYTNPEGQIRDIRDFDHLAMMTILGRNDPAAMQRWTNARLNLSLAENIRFHEQRSLISHAAQTDEINFTGLASRLKPNMGVMTALSKALSDSNLRISATNNNNLDMTQRFVPQVMNQFDPQMLTGSLYAPSYGNNSGMMGGYNLPHAANRWMS